MRRSGSLCSFAQTKKISLSWTGFFLGRVNVFLPTNVSFQSKQNFASVNVSVHFIMHFKKPTSRIVIPLSGNVVAYVDQPHIRSTLITKADLNRELSPIHFPCLWSTWEEAGDHTQRLGPPCDEALKSHKRGPQKIALQNHQLNIRQWFWVAQH